MCVCVCVCVIDGVMIPQSLINVNGRTVQLFSVKKTFLYTLYNPSINICVTDDGGGVEGVCVFGKINPFSQ